MTPDTNLSTLRQVIRTRRGRLTGTERSTYSVQITTHLQHSELLKTANRIGSFLTFDGEVDTQAIHHHIWTQGKQLYLPCLHAAPEALLSFKTYTQETALYPNRYHILEPNDDAQSVPADELDIVLVPLVAFDDHGHRIGMGKGYYDRTFAFLLENTAHHVKLVGLAYQLQRTTEIIPENWDVPLHAVVTEQGVMQFKK